MRKFLYAAAVLALAGCSSYSEIAYWNSDTLTNDGDRPIATFVTQNFSYRLFGAIPFCTGVPWTEGDEDIKADFDVKFFADEATIDGNLISLRHALDRIGGSHRIAELHTTVEDSYLWSLFIMRRREVHTQCQILPR